ISADIQWAFLQDLESSNDLPAHVVVEPENRPQTTKEIQDKVFKLLKGNKGERMASQLVSMCSEDELPCSIINFLREIYSLHPKPSEIEPFNFDQKLEDSEEE